METWQVVGLVIIGIIFGGSFIWYIRYERQRAKLWREYWESNPSKPPKGE